MKALLLVDIQNDFLPGGALEVKQGDKIIPVVNRLIPNFEIVVATKDWHPPNHKSFASNHPGREQGDIIRLMGQEQILWPDHCIQDTPGADFSDELVTDHISRVFFKGTDKDIDSYSGFYDNGHLKSTGLSDYLKDRNIDRVYIAGLAADYCVKFTVLDALKEGFETILVLDGTRAVNLNEGDFEKAVDEMKKAGAMIMESSRLLDG